MSVKSIKAEDFNDTLWELCDMCRKPTPRHCFNWRYRPRWILRLQERFNGVKVCPLCCSARVAVQAHFAMKAFIDNIANVKCFGCTIVAEGEHDFVTVDLTVYEHEDCTCISCQAVKLYDNLFPEDPVEEVQLEAV